MKEYLVYVKIGMFTEVQPISIFHIEADTVADAIELAWNKLPEMQDVLKVEEIDI